MANWELVNPSDPYTFTSSFEVAALVVALMGSAYAGKELGEDFGDVEDGRAVPFGLFGGFEDWYQKEFGSDSLSALGEKYLEVAEALETVMIGSGFQRRRMERVLGAISHPGERRRAEEVWHDERQTSVTDFRAWAVDLAKGLRKKYGAKAEEGA